VAGLREYPARPELAVQTLDGRDFGGQRINFSAVPTGQTRDWRHAHSTQDKQDEGLEWWQLCSLDAENRKGLPAPCANNSTKRHTAFTHYPCSRFHVASALFLLSWHFLFILPLLSLPLVRVKSFEASSIRAEIK